MESGLRVLFLGRPERRGLLAALAWLAYTFCGAPAVAADAPVIEQVPVVQPQLKRREITPDKIDTEDFEIGVYGGLLSVEDFGANGVVGARLAYHVSEGLFFEAVYGQSTTRKTSYEVLSGSAPLLTDKERELSYYNISLGYNILPGEAFVRKWAFTSALYLIGGIGSTEFAGDDRLTWNVGAGYRVLLNDWLALHLDARDHMFDMDLLGEKTTTHNLETHGSVTVFF